MKLYYLLLALAIQNSILKHFLYFLFTNRIKRGESKDFLIQALALVQVLASAFNKISVRFLQVGSNLNFQVLYYDVKVVLLIQGCLSHL